MVLLSSLRSSMAAFITLDVLVVAARLAVRTKLRCVGYDDYIIVVGLAGFIIMCAFCFQALAKGFGLSDPAAIANHKGYSIQEATKYFTISQITYVVSFPVVRLSVAFVLLRISKESMPRVRRLLIASMVVVSVYALGCILIDSLQCIPLRVLWAGGPGKCLSFMQLAGLGFAVSALDIASALFYAVLPIFMLMGVQIGFRTKFAILFLLGLGAITIAISIVRLRSLVLIVHAKDQSAILSLELESFIYSVLEFGISILTASLVALRPVIKYLPFGSHGRSSHDRERSHALRSGRRHASGGHDLELHSQHSPADAAWPSSDSDSQRDILAANKTAAEANDAADADADANNDANNDADSAKQKLKVWKHSKVEVHYEPAVIEDSR